MRTYLVCRGHDNVGARRTVARSQHGMTALRTIVPTSVPNPGTDRTQQPEHAQRSTMRYHARCSTKSLRRASHAAPASRGLDSSLTCCRALVLTIRCALVVVLARAATANVALDYIPLLDPVERLKTDAALRSLLDHLHLLFEVAQLVDGALVHHLLAAHDAEVGSALHLALEHLTPSHHADALADLKCLQHLRTASDGAEPVGRRGRDQVR
mmetsp:Transcript_6975/g.18994  ORF Transcript_6975/g.18994 Transcript_6975/m.18994 type:complete len:212 (-) Transcript_6975:1736-2371(-)